MYTGIKTNEGTKIVSVEDKAKLYKYFDMVRKHTLTKVEATYLEPGQLNSKFYGLYLFDENNNQFDKISDLQNANIILEKMGIDNKLPEYYSLKKLQAIRDNHIDIFDFNNCMDIS